MTHDPLADFDAEIFSFLRSNGVNPDLVQLSTPPEREFGERATNVAFRLSRERRLAPKEIAAAIAKAFSPDHFTYIRDVQPAGAGFINFYLNYRTFVPHVLNGIEDSGPNWGRRPHVVGQKVVVEHTSVNPNKEWHIGHVRNAVLGDVVARVLRAAGHEVQVQNYIDDTGLQAAQSVFAITHFPEQEKPAEKYDHYAGRLYVKVAAELSAEKDLRATLETTDDAGERRSIEARLENITHLQRGVFNAMRALESGEYENITHRILNAQLQTAFRLGVFYDLLNWESNLVASHTFDAAMDLLRQKGAVSVPEEGRYAGATVIHTGDQVTEDGEPRYSVLIRSNGIPTYEGKDIAYHMWKYQLVPDRLKYRPFMQEPNGETLWSTSLHGEDWHRALPERIINIIAVNQTLAQQTVKEALRAAGFPQAADSYFHLAYGLVKTREGMISGRRGTSASGDTIIDEAVRAAHERIREKRSQDLTDDEMETIAEAVGVGAVRYFMTQYNPMREITFDVKDVVSYDGNTGLYIQYALVRMAAILRRASGDYGVTEGEIDAGDLSLLQHEQEKRLAYHLAQYPELLSDVCRTLSVNLVAEFAFGLATTFSQFYRDCGVLNAQPDLRAARLRLVRTVHAALAHACGLLGVPLIERL